MTYEITYTGAAAKQISKLPKQIRKRILDALEILAEDPRGKGARKLVGEKTAWRVRIGDYRVIYDLFDAKLIITVVRVAHRREVYKQL